MTNEILLYLSAHFVFKKGFRKFKSNNFKFQLQKVALSTVISYFNYFKSYPCIFDIAVLLMSFFKYLKKSYFDLVTISYNNKQLMY